MKIAIIGAAIGQKAICEKAKEMGLETYCFAWEKGAICKNVVDHFFPISIFETEQIAKICIKEQIDGVVSNASEDTAEASSKIAELINKPGLPSKTLTAIKNKRFVRETSQAIPDLYPIKGWIYNKNDVPTIFPCIIKPITGSSKQGVSFVKSKEEFLKAIEYAKEPNNHQIIIEEYFDGQEISVEALSFKGQHYIYQITDKENSGAPHFVELGHHEPSQLDDSTLERVRKIIPTLLTSLNFTNGASHTEMKIDRNGRIALIEVNPRGGGDEISNTLVALSSGIDYLRGMIEVALGTFKRPYILHPPQYAGIYFLCEQTRQRLDFFRLADKQSWLIEKKINNFKLTNATSNYNRNGYLIYCANHKIDAPEKQEGT